MGFSKHLLGKVEMLLRKYEKKSFWKMGDFRKYHVQGKYVVKCSDIIVSILVLRTMKEILFKGLLKFWGAYGRLSSNKEKRVLGTGGRLRLQLTIPRSDGVVKTGHFAWAWELLMKEIRFIYSARASTMPTNLKHEQKWSGGTTSVNGFEDNKLF